MSRPIGQPYAGDSSAGVSATPSPSPVHPPSNVWRRPSQCPASWVSVSPSLYGAKVPPGTVPESMTIPSYVLPELPEGRVAHPSNPAPLLAQTFMSPAPPTRVAAFIAVSREPAELSFSALNQAVFRVTVSVTRSN